MPVSVEIASTMSCYNRYLLCQTIEVLIFDIVRLFKRSHLGYKYILMAMCLASKYPEAIPRKEC